ncbi:HIT family protein [Chitinilyticum aquatile]|uniref:HIT family protein n=1 Tax=Chitinilyticum aquatile TaxID=362520 RepID=UPI0004178F49|nr:HIT family protein [Chitinilyticum aquatile]
MSSTCPLCREAGGELLWQSDLCRVVLADEPDYPGFCRVILTRHAAEMSDLAQGERDELMRVVYAVEAALRATLDVDKINLASLGNMVPHMHWHVIPRWQDDRHFPAPVWAQPARAASHSVTDAQLAALRQQLQALQP